VRLIAARSTCTSEVKHWTKELGVDKPQLQKWVDKVGSKGVGVYRYPSLKAGRRAVCSRTLERDPRGVSDYCVRRLS
jgi:hypothetical protein